MATECPKCEESFENLGGHLTLSTTCDHPKLSQKQREVTTGLLMGDGWIDVGQNNGNPRICSKMISEKYLNYIDEIFGVFGTGVRLLKTAEESAKDVSKRGFVEGAKAEDYSDVYIWKSRRHPDFDVFADWYSSGKKIWPENIELTPTILKHWYCGDGHWHNSGTSNYIIISMANEYKNTSKIDNMFEKSGLPSPNNYVIQKVNGNMQCNAEFNVSESKQLWDYMGKPLPNFEYKWPERYK